MSAGGELADEYVLVGRLVYVSELVADEYYDCEEC